MLSELSSCAYFPLYLSLGQNADLNSSGATHSCLKAVDPSHLCLNIYELAQSQMSPLHASVDVKRNIIEVFIMLCKGPQNSTPPPGTLTDSLAVFPNHSEQVTEILPSAIN